MENLQEALTQLKAPQRKTNGPDRENDHLQQQGLSSIITELVIEKQEFIILQKSQDELEQTLMSALGGIGIRPDLG